MSIAEDILKIARGAREASLKVGRLGSNVKNTALLKMAEGLVKGSAALKAANAKDLEGAGKKGLSRAMVDRLTITDKVIKGMADSLKEVAALPDPVGEVTSMWTRPNGLRVGRMRIPIGVIGIIYEAARR
jgi:glutamate-5-semialdehyde dehydrogenase